MANITAEDVKNLRLQTGAGMMDCKQALAEANGDFEKAIDNLRKKGQKVAANRSNRLASEGLVLAKTSNDKKRGVLIVVNCETDFVAKNEDFITLANMITDIAIDKNPLSLEELNKQPYNGDNITVENRVIEEIGKIGEKIEISAFNRIEAERVIAYNHPGNKLASIVGLNKADNQVNEIGKELAMQIAAMSPISIDKDDVPEDVINREIEIGKEQARTEGKPEEMLEKIAIGKLNKFYKESTLLNQQYIKDNKKTVGQFLQEYDKDLKITTFKRIALGM